MDFCLPWLRRHCNCKGSHLLASLKRVFVKGKRSIGNGFGFCISLSQRWQDRFVICRRPTLSRVPHSCRCRCCSSCCCCGCSRKSTPRCPCLSWRRSPRLLSACAPWPVFTPGLFTPCLTGTKDLETLLLTDQAALPYLGMLGYYPMPGHYILTRNQKNIH